MISTQKTAAVPPPPSPARAIKRERSRITSTSSTTAAPSKATPTRLRNTFNSIRVWAEMLTLVAASTRPMKKPCCKSKPKGSAATIPRTTGATTPIIPASTAGRPARPIASRSTSSPAINMTYRTPRWARWLRVSSRCSSLNTGQCSISNMVGPRISPASNSPSTAGSPARVLR